jgi:hypothetical protein
LNAGFHQAHEEWFPCQSSSTQPSNLSHKLQPQSGNVHCYLQLSSRPCYREILGHWAGDTGTATVLLQKLSIFPEESTCFWTSITFVLLANQKIGAKC